ncbi:MAG TPA: hypothetical protein VM118_05275 [Acidobacteriota bacterium]|nr:hypothetical protein [Acidobacteriota bacterium]
MMRPERHQSASPFTGGLWVTVLLFIALGCSHPPWPPYDGSGRRVLERLETRSLMTQSATYRVRWRSVGTEPHATFFLDIAYKAPGRFRVTAEGPFGLPAFTAVIVEDSFWFVDHQIDTLIVDQLENLADYQIPMAEFFSGHWRDLFSGGWGPGMTTRTLALGLDPGVKQGEYLTVWKSSRWNVKWSQRRAAPEWIRAETKEEGETVLVAQTWFGQFREEYPFWEMKRIRITGFPGGGEHQWKILRQEYNLTVPDRFFEPLRQPAPAPDRGVW